MPDPSMLPEAPRSYVPQAIETSLSLTPQAAAEIARIQGAIMVAQHPALRRNITQARINMLQNAARPSFAAKAFWKPFKRGDTLISDLNIRAAEMMAREFRNIKWGFDIVEQTPSQATVVCRAWDVECNSEAQRQIKVNLKQKLSAAKGGGFKILDDPRDIAEHIASQAQRVIRVLIISLMPVDLVDDVRDACNDTIAKGEAAQGPIIDRIRVMAEEFAKIGVSVQMLEKHLGHKMEDTVVSEIVSLKTVFKAIRDGEAEREEYFDVKILDAQAAAAAGQGESPAPPPASGMDKAKAAAKRGKGAKAGASEASDGQSGLGTAQPPAAEAGSSGTPAQPPEAPAASSDEVSQVVKNLRGDAGAYKEALSKIADPNGTSKWDSLSMKHFGMGDDGPNRPDSCDDASTLSQFITEASAILQPKAATPKK